MAASCCDCGKKCEAPSYDTEYIDSLVSTFEARTDALLAELSKEFSFTEMGRVDENHRAVRFCTSWATRPDQVKALCDKLRQLA